MQEETQVVTHTKWYNSYIPYLSPSAPSASCHEDLTPKPCPLPSEYPVSVPETTRVLPLCCHSNTGVGMQLSSVNKFVYARLGAGGGGPGGGGSVGSNDMI